MKKVGCLAVAVFWMVASLSGCASMSARQQACAKGAAIGAALGGATGGVVRSTGDDDHDDEGRGIITGGVIGAVIGGLIGCAMVEEAPPPPKAQPAPPKPEPKPAPPVVEKVEPPPKAPERIVLRGINFDFDKSNIKPEFAPVLDEAASILKRNPNVSVVVEGHCDAVGTDSYNQSLSERRAKSVQQYLTKKGITNRLEIKGFGESQPIATNKTADGRALNRRVEFKVSQ